MPAVPSPFQSPVTGTSVARRSSACATCCPRTGRCAAARCRGGRPRCRSGRRRSSPRRRACRRALRVELAARGRRLAEHRVVDRPVAGRVDRRRDGTVAVPVAPEQHRAGRRRDLVALVDRAVIRLDPDRDVARVAQAGTERSGKTAARAVGSAAGMAGAPGVTASAASDVGAGPPTRTPAPSTATSTAPTVLPPAAPGAGEGGHDAGGASVQVHVRLSRLSVLRAPGRPRC